MKATTLSNATVQAQGDALVALLSNGWLRIYNGAQPATADTAIGVQLLLAEMRFGTPAAGPTPASGIITFNAIAPDASANNSGTASWYRMFKADGTTPVMDGTVDVAGNTPNLALSTTTITAGQAVSVSTFTHTLSKTTAGV